jgi:hypothetical protein
VLLSHSPHRRGGRPGRRRRFEAPGTTEAPKELVRFTAAEGAGGHCECAARVLYHQRVFDWLDEVLEAPSRQHSP